MRGHTVTLFLVETPNPMNKVERYKIFNRNRKIKAINFNENKATLLFKIIPFLLHANYPDLPGYINDPNCPYGIHRFVPEEYVNKEIFQRYFPNSKAVSQTTGSPFSENPCVHSLKTIGSIGTIAQTEKSDCDYWLSIRYNEIGPEGLLLLEEKCKAIEEWAMSRDNEVHFFLMDIDQTKENKFETLAEAESAGSAIQVLLKDELFRTHILVAGKMLLWWLIPPGLTEDEYKSYIDTVIKKKKLNPENFVDLGYLSDIPKSEVFGACLWQMNKALDSPFKSVIKFAYLELLLRNKTQTLPLFSDTVKCLVTYPEKQTPSTQGLNLELNEIDPYLLLAREIIKFYQKEASEQKRANLIRECMFLKTLEGMESQKRRSKKRKNLESTIDLMENWHLLPNNCEHFVNLRSWNFKQLTELGTKVHDYLLETYKRLRWISQNLGEETEVAITQRDLSVLGRKLFTYYEKKNNKIEYIRSLSRETMTQIDVTFHFASQNGTSHYFALQGIHEHFDNKKQTELLITRKSDLITLVTWLMINGIINDKTNLHLSKNLMPLDLVEIQTVTKVMLHTFPTINFAKISGDQLLKKESITRALAIVNLNKEPMKDSKKLQSTIITANSYGEYFVKEYNTVTQLKNALRLLLTKHYVSRWNNNLEVFIPPQQDQHLIKKLIYQ